MPSNSFQATPETKSLNNKKRKKKKNKNGDGRNGDIVNNNENGLRGREEPTSTKNGRDKTPPSAHAQHHAHDKDGTAGTHEAAKQSDQNSGTTLRGGQKKHSRKSTTESLLDDILNDPNTPELAKIIETTDDTTGEGSKKARVSQARSDSESETDNESEPGTENRSTSQTFYKISQEEMFELKDIYENFKSENEKLLKNKKELISRITSKDELLQKMQEEILSKNMQKNSHNNFQNGNENESATSTQVNFMTKDKEVPKLTSLSHREIKKFCKQLESFKLWQANQRRKGMHTPNIRFRDCMSITFLESLASTFPGKLGMPRTDLGNGVESFNTELTATHPSEEKLEQFLNEEKELTPAQKESEIEKLKKIAMDTGPRTFQTRFQQWVKKWLNVDDDVFKHMKSKDIIKLILDSLRPQSWADNMSDAAKSLKANWVAIRKITDPICVKKAVIEEVRKELQKTMESFAIAGEIFGKSKGKKDISQEICKNFQKGKCQRGENCRRKHTPNKKRNADVLQKRSEILCRDHAKGKCPRGKSCHFAHPNTPTNNNKKHKTTSPGVCFNYLQGKCTNKNCKFSHDEKQMQALKLRLMQYFSDDAATTESSADQVELKKLQLKKLQTDHAALTRRLEAVTQTMNNNSTQTFGSNPY